ncbi:hypothetical protein CDAR_272761 [Caerostris darwini]|uniref:Uncharacterized protein n=1 Tax=Caerostris darwini TaxID=1538125 RepID=A0AAV4UZJ4_9ARAC|nr:hypothetical protein CDAR_272761 [Caerostris darwini]
MIERRSKSNLFFHPKEDHFSGQTETFVSILCVPCSTSAASFVFSPTMPPDLEKNEASLEISAVFIDANLKQKALETSFNEPHLEDNR